MQSSYIRERKKERTQFCTVSSEKELSRSGGDKDERISDRSQELTADLATVLTPIVLMTLSVCPFTHEYHFFMTPFSRVCPQINGRTLSKDARTNSST